MNEHDALAAAVDEATRGIWRATSIIRLIPDMPGEFRGPLLSLAHQKLREGYEALPRVMTDVERLI